ncbi:hypothetical protein A4G16_02665 [Mannheimia granulomatis]|uniref:Uncharacterized protein n=1 Tax=Mannheimia granulomatis TaxID=85402 RepID=A0A6G8JGL5_9PAST|nr:hypothetical protein [Mannheimia granulomatis]QIM66352.1 hypothetical protein A4G16_02665 [Mannheimia granulomatis]
MQAQITFYDIQRCGLYARKGNGTQPLFLGVQDMLEQLKNWADGKDLVDTDIFQNKNKQSLCTYLADLKSTPDSAIMVLWNQVPHTDSGVLSLPNRAKFGQIQHADANSIKADSIPGYPTYFWFIPRSKVFATICFNTNVNGRLAMEAYIKQFMCQFSSYVVKELNEQTKILEIKGYSADPTDTHEKVFHYPPSFYSCIYPKPQELELLKRQAPQIKKVTKKATCSYLNPTSLSMFQKVTGLFTGLPQQLSSNQDFNVKAEVSVNGLTKAEVQGLFDEWEQEVDSWQSLDYGFKIGDKQHWFSHAAVKWEGELALSFTEQNSFGNITALLSELESKKSSILSVIS